MSRKEVLPPYNEREILKKRLNELKMALRIVKERQNSHLKGKLYVCKSHGTYQFRIIDENIKYISKKETEIIHQYVQKEYDEKLIKILQRTIKKIEKFIPYMGKNPSDEALKSITESKRKYVNPACLSSENYALIWKSITYKKKGFSKDLLQLYTANGERVRSKSEIIIAETLTRFGIPYRYEFPVKLYVEEKVKIFYPDFYCLNLRTRCEFIWEHFGMMDNLEYACSAVKKIKIYEENGFFQGINLLFTMETTNSPICVNQIEELVTKFLV